MKKLIVQTMDTCSGSPRIPGSRMTCADITFKLVSNSGDVQDLLKTYDYFSESVIKDCLEFCARKACLETGIGFCSGCTLDDSEYEGEAERVDVWKLAKDLLRGY